MKNGIRRVFRPVAIAVVVLAAVAIMLITFRRQSPGPISSDFSRAKRVVPSTGPADTRAVAGNAIIEPAEPETRVSTDVAGRIAAVRVNEGDRVVRGNPLFELDDQIQRAELHAAEAELAAAEGVLARTMHGLRSSEILAANSDAQAARSRALLAVGELHRAEELAKSTSISNAELDTIRRKAEVERASEMAAAARASSARAGSRREDIIIADAQVRSAQAKRDSAKAVLDRYAVQAPVDGTVLRVKARVGEYYNPQRGEPIIVLGDVSKLRARMDVDERDISRVRMGATGYATASAFGEQRFPGKVVEIARRMGRRTIRVDDPIDRVDVKVLEVVLELEGNPPLVPGLRAVVHLDVSEH